MILPPADRPTTPAPTLSRGASRVGATLRQGLWRGVLELTGGLTVTGPPPTVPSILVANHSSHADTAALLAGIPARRKPVFVAAADYWFARPERRILVQSLAAAVPVHRTNEGSYAALRAATAEVLAHGGVVIVYPEGTRTTTGEIGEFHSGAVRLADDLDVPLVPVALLGTRQMLAKNGRFRATPVEIRYGAPFDSEGLAADPATAGIASVHLRREVVALLGRAPVADPVSPMWERVAHLVDGRGGLVAAFVWGVAEATSWPVIAEMYLALFAVARPRRVLPCALALTAGTVTGVVLLAALGRRGITLPAPLTTARMRTRASDDLAAGASGIRRQALNGIPVKVYAAEAGRLAKPLLRLGVATAGARAARNLTVAAGATGLATLFPAPVRRRYGLYLAATAVAWALAQRSTYRHWR